VETDSHSVARTASSSLPRCTAVGNKLRLPTGCTGTTSARRPQTLGPYPSAWWHRGFCTFNRTGTDCNGFIAYTVYTVYNTQLIYLFYSFAMPFTRGARAISDKKMARRSTNPLARPNKRPQHPSLEGSIAGPSLESDARQALGTTRSPVLPRLLSQAARAPSRRPILLSKTPSGMRLSPGNRDRPPRWPPRPSPT
jgi:hypothetical protein